MPAKKAILIIAILCATAGVLLVAHPAVLHAPAAPNSSQLPASAPTQGQADVDARATQPVPAPATLVVAGRHYPLPSAGQSVLAAMQGLASSGTLSFSGREFPSLGFFVESIDGVSNAGGKYWILYHNGAQSQIGASNATISPGDVIEWRYE